MKKIKTLFRRIGRMSLERLKININQVHLKSGRAKIMILADMIWCAARYGVGYLDYNVFGFAFVRGSKARKTYMTVNHNNELVSKVNDRAFAKTFLDKTEFNKTFSAFLGREWLDLRAASKEDFENFLQGKANFFAKITDGCGGAGIKKIRVCEYDGSGALYDELKGQKMFLAEETLAQHAEMSRLNPSSINTLRITSALSGGQAHIMYCLVRIGDGTKETDNISSGGMYSTVDEDGRVHGGAFCDKTGECYEKHPKNGQAFAGFRIPFYADAVETVKEAALAVPQIRYVGWDVAITPDGPALIEGNIVPGYDMCQNYCHSTGAGGILPKFREVFAEELPQK